MEYSIGTLEKVLIEELDIDSAIIEIETFLKRTTEYSKHVCILRALKSYAADDFMDFCGHLRQCMTFFKCSINITSSLYDRLFEFKNMFGFIFKNIEGLSVNIETTILADKPSLKSSYAFEYRRVNVPTVGDGRLYRYYTYTHYTSLAQKMLMYFIANMKDDEVLLGCLPTGAGKSLSWQLPAVSKAYQGLIIVVVPTVALAMDHERSSKNIYDNNPFSGTYPLAYFSDIGLEKKNQIYQEIEKGILPVLYISPEALQVKEFQEKIFKSAETGKISALVIDEAHLIVSWGTSFRPEFQLLASFRNNLKQRCKDGLRTILLSATFTDEDVKIIKNVFNDEIFTEFRADELRPEPTYYMHKCSDENERTELIKRLICTVPRPVIVYTVTPEQATNYYNCIKSLGYKNIALFTGKTSNEERKSIIKKWSDDKVDIIVATSAFGMGVDKPDVRTIITAYIPETVSRYYQEVGRAGRDGYTSLNYFLTFDEVDNEYVNSLTKGAILTVDSLIKRWMPLLAEARRESSNTVWLDVNVPPEHLRFNQTGRRNASWNKDVILLLYRAGLIEIIDVYNVNSNDYKILVLLKNIRVLESEELLEKSITVFRDAERKRIKDGVDNVRKLLKSERANCYARYFTKEFPFTMELCNGCPYCRKRGLSNYNRGGNVIVKSNKASLANGYTVLNKSVFSSLLLASNSMMLSLREVCNKDDICKCIEFLIKNNVNIVITPLRFDETTLLELLSFYDNNKYLILSLDEAMKIDMKWLNGVCGLIYTDNKAYNEKLYKFGCRYLEDNLDNKIIHIAQSEQYIYSEMRALSELIDQNLSGEKYFIEGEVL